MAQANGATLWAGTMGAVRKLHERIVNHGKYETRMEVGVELTETHIVQVSGAKSSWKPLQSQPIPAHWSGSHCRSSQRRRFESDPEIGGA